MIRWINGFLRRARVALSNARGETILESVVSMMVFSIFTLAIMTTLLTALRITGVATREANEKQMQVNQLVLAEYTDADTLPVELMGDGINLQISVKRMQAEGLVAFRPNEGG